jgi:leucyl aminopeptidase
VGSHADKPRAVLRSHAGPTVEVLNTDAEGRLCLADAFSWVQERHAPAALVDVATLTGACVVALGEYVAGLFANHDALAAALAAAGGAAREPLWRLPVLEGHRREIEEGSAVADLASTGKGREGGACTAAAFLQKFVRPGVAWAHLDVAGPAMATAARGAAPAGATGFGSALLTEFVLAAAEARARPWAA